MSANLKETWIQVPPGLFKSTEKVNNVNISDNNIICARGVFTNLQLAKLTYGGNPLLKKLTGRSKSKKSKAKEDVRKIDYDVNDSDCMFDMPDDFAHYG